jgi:hypothetical protein
MTTAQRAYINKEYNQYVDDECLRFRSIPMAVVNKILKQKRPENDYPGIKRVFNNVPARPQNINALATTIARMQNRPYSQVDNIAKLIAQEEVTEVRQFVRENKDPYEVPVAFAPQVYVPEQATRSTLGVPLAPISASELSELNARMMSGYVRGSGPTGRFNAPGAGRPPDPPEVKLRKTATKTSSKIIEQIIGRAVKIGEKNLTEKSLGNRREESLLLGDEPMTYNSPPLRPGSTSATKSVNKLARFFESQGTEPTPSGSTPHTTRRMDQVVGSATQRPDDPGWEGFGMDK